MKKRLVLSTFLALAILSSCRSTGGGQRATVLMRITVWLMFAAALVLLYLQAFVIHAFCRYCLFSAAVTFLLTGLVVAIPAQSLTPKARP